MHLQEKLSLPFAVTITFLLLFVPCIGFLFPNALQSRWLLSLSKHYRIINLPIFAIFSLHTVSGVTTGWHGVATATPYETSATPLATPYGALRNIIL